MNKRLIYLFLYVGNKLNMRVVNEALIAGSDALLESCPLYWCFLGHHGPGIVSSRQDPRLQLHAVQGSAEDEVARPLYRGAQSQPCVGFARPQTDQRNLLPLSGIESV